MNRERIQRAIDALAGLEIRPSLLSTFDMKLWLDEYSACRMAACAGGWLHVLGTFKEEGYSCNTYGPVFENECGVLALARLFDIHPMNARPIFIPGDGPTEGPAARDAVVAKLRKLLEG